VCACVCVVCCVTSCKCLYRPCSEQNAAIERRRERRGVCFGRRRQTGRVADGLRVEYVAERQHERGQRAAAGNGNELSTASSQQCCGASWQPCLTTKNHNNWLGLCTAVGTGVSIDYCHSVNGDAVVFVLQYFTGKRFYLTASHFCAVPWIRGSRYITLTHITLIIMFLIMTTRFVHCCESNPN